MIKSFKFFSTVFLYIIYCSNITLALYHIEISGSKSYSFTIYIHFWKFSLEDRFMLIFLRFLPSHTCTVSFSPFFLPFYDFNASKYSPFSTIQSDSRTDRRRSNRRSNLLCRCFLRD